MSNVILIVDDSPVYQRLARIALEEAGFEVAAAADGVEALATVERVRPGLITVDILMPRLDGLSALRALKENPATRDIPV